MTNTRVTPADRVNTPILGDYPIGQLMSLDKPHGSLTPAEQEEVVENLARAKWYGSPRRVWVEDGHVLVEGHDGALISMTPEVAIEMGRMLSEAGANSLINRIMDATDKGSP